MRINLHIKTPYIVYLRKSTNPPFVLDIYSQILLFLLLAEQHHHQSVCFEGLINSSMFDNFDKSCGHVYGFV